MVFVCGGVGDVVGCADGGGRAARRFAVVLVLGTSCFWEIKKIFYFLLAIAGELHV